jgi:hypothetical protein
MAAFAATTEETAVDQVAYRLPLSAEATRMFQAMGIKQIICDI